MPCVAEFGIIDEFEKDKDYSEYQPEKYNCIAIDDDLINNWWSELSQVKTYFHCYQRPERGLARWGVTLIPPESLEQLVRIFSNGESGNASKEIRDLIKLVQEAISNNKYVIHYGV